MFRNAVKQDIAIREGKQKQHTRDSLRVRTLENRLYEVGLPLLRAAAPFAEKEQIRSTGMFLYKGYELGRYQSASERKKNYAFQVEDSVLIQYVHPSFPAYKAGLRKGDAILAIEGESTADLTAEEAMERIDAHFKKYPSIHLRTQKGERVIPGVEVAPYHLLLVLSNKSVTFTNGFDVFLTEGMMHYADTRDELAYLLSNRIAQNLLKQFWYRAGQVSVGMLADLLVLYSSGLPTFGLFGKLGEGFGTKEYIRDADFVSLYLLKRAGFSLKHVADFWLDFERKYPYYNSTDVLSFPPSPEERKQMIQQSIQTINRRWQEISS